MNVIRKYGKNKRICEFSEREEDIRYEIQEYKTLKRYGEIFTGWITKEKGYLLQCIVLVENGRRIEM